MYKISLFCANELKYIVPLIMIFAPSLYLSTQRKLNQTKRKTVAVVEWGLKIHIGEVSSSYNESKLTDFHSFEENSTKPANRYL